MRATGIVRRMDDLGRIVIPREIRRMARLREGDPMEIYIEGKDIVLRKYSPFALFGDGVSLIHAIHQFTQAPVLLCDREGVVEAVNIPKLKYAARHLTDEADNIINSRKSYVREDETPKVHILNGSDLTAKMIVPIVAGDDLLGALVIPETGEMFNLSELERYLTFAAKYLKLCFEQCD